MTGRFKITKREKRILAIDFGEKRVGLALSDPLGVIAKGMETLEPRDEGDLLGRIAETVAQEGVTEIVVGLPLNMDGSKGPTANKVLKFTEKLKDRVKKPIVTWDERLSSVSAHKTLNDMRKRIKGKKGEVDRLAATIILQSYLESQR